MIELCSIMMMQNKYPEYLKESISHEQEEVDASYRRIVIYPEVSILTNEAVTGYEIKIYLPDVQKDDIDLRLKENYLCIRCKAGQILYSGCFKVKYPINIKKIDSIYKNGYLYIRAPFLNENLNLVNKME